MTKFAMEYSAWYNIVKAEASAMDQVFDSPPGQTGDSTSAKQNFVPCKVCGDKASGYHYGVTSCEGCKGFFRRSIQKQIEYRCLRDGKCMVIRLNRNRCQYCRFKKCLAVGMSRDSVRYGRVPRRCKIAEESVSSSADAASEALLQEARHLAIYDVILALSQAHHSQCVLTSDRVKDITPRPFSLLRPKDIKQPLESAEDVEQQRLCMWQNFASLVTPTIHRVVEFGKRIPSFSELSQDDQLILIKSSFFELWLIRMASMFTAPDGTVTFADGSTVPRDQLETIYTRAIVQTWFDFSASFNLLRLNDTEVGIFSGIALLTSERLGVTGSAAVDKIREKLLEALKLQLSRNHSSEPEIFNRLLMRLPELHLIGNAHSEFLNNYRRQWTKLKLPPLFAEIFDVPKGNDEEEEEEEAAEEAPSAVATGTVRETEVFNFNSQALIPPPLSVSLPYPMPPMSLPLGVDHLQPSPSQLLTAMDQGMPPHTAVDSALASHSDYSLTTLQSAPAFSQSFPYTHPMDDSPSRMSDLKTSQGFMNSQ